MKPDLEPCKYEITGSSTFWLTTLWQSPLLIMYMTVVTWDYVPTSGGIYHFVLFKPVKHKCQNIFEIVYWEQFYLYMYIWIYLSINIYIYTWYFLKMFNHHPLVYLEVSNQPRRCWTPWPKVLRSTFAPMGVTNHCWCWPQGHEVPEVHRLTLTLTKDAWDTSRWDNQPQKGGSILCIHIYIYQYYVYIYISMYMYIYMYFHNINTNLFFFKEVVVLFFVWGGDCGGL